MLRISSIMYIFKSDRHLVLRSQTTLCTGMWSACHYGESPVASAPTQTRIADKGCVTFTVLWTNNMSHRGRKLMLIE